MAYEDGNKIRDEGVKHLPKPEEAVLGKVRAEQRGSDDSLQHRLFQAGRAGFGYMGCKVDGNKIGDEWLAPFTKLS